MISSFLGYDKVIPTKSIVLGRQVYAMGLKVFFLHSYFPGPGTLRASLTIIPFSGDFYVNKSLHLC
jgi:hypothetical protein